ncbi:MAG: ABC transporter ATP-binding protein [Proteobacteria bacterium]|nr:ABC transporter ATP-binding protein [Pseudomonadota bacterium]
MLPLKISEISKSFNNKPVLDQVSFEVKQNDIFGFIGLNGVGKTTLIKIALDLLDQENGEIEIFGISRVLPESRKKICYLPEKFQPSQHLKGEEFIKFVLDFYAKKYDAKRAQKICENLDLRFEVLKQKVTKYSKGMMQKLGLLAVFLSEADLIILDEPMSGLDPKARIALKKELIAYKNLGKTIFFSSHILSDMDEICDAIAVLNETKIVFEGTPKAFKDKHQEDSLDKAFLKEIRAI